MKIEERKMDGRMEEWKNVFVAWETIEFQNITP